MGVPDKNAAFKQTTENRPTEMSQTQHDEQKPQARCRDTNTCWYWLPGLL